MIKRLLLLLALLLAFTTVAACSTESASLSPSATVIDVRTPAEYAAGHLEGAVNIDVESPTFTASLSGLDKAGQYAVYCRTGRRSAIAADQMKTMGFTNITDLGSKENAASVTGKPMVQ